ncbi:MAG: formate dehydrogenase accessory sulfurtransferase FdhD [Chloroflexi bacterium]|nr:MAG: formate dehydrogenase family accessory protein FdhD [Phototrophicales bacterium]RMF79696.1 MAG: formate dehydrogenase accessory sulfurtransferase FdhD [Chloroflexota bacterium]
MQDETHREAGFVPYTYWSVEGGNADLIDGGMIEESLVSIYVNGQELATIMCSPLEQEALALGFLYNEHVVDSIDEVGVVKANVARSVVDVLLKRADFAPPRRMILTSGCGGGVTFQYLADTHPALETDFATTPDIIFKRMRDMQGAAVLYNKVRGVHTAILADVHQMLVSAEDVGRHNAIDKVTGKALQQGIATHDCILMSSGRISSEMLQKARRMGVPLVASRTAPTSVAVQLAQAWNICIVGYVRRGSLRVYTHPQRLGLPVVERIEQVIDI